MYAMTAFTEIFLAVALVVLLRSNRVGFKQSDSVIDRLVLYTVSSGAATALNAIAAIVAAAAFPSSFMHLVFGSLSAKSK